MHLFALLFLRPLEILQRLARYFDGFLLRREKGRIAKAEFTMKTFIGHREHRAGFLAAHLGDGQKRRRDHIDTLYMLLVQLPDQFRRLLK